MLFTFNHLRRGLVSTFYAVGPNRKNLSRVNFSLRIKRTK